MFSRFDPSQPRLVASITDDAAAAAAAAAGAGGGGDKAAADKVTADKAASDKAAAAAAAAGGGGRNEKVVPMTRKGLAEHARKAADAGAQRKLLQVAKEHGFGTVEEMQAALKGLAGKGTDKGKGAAGGGGGDKGQQGKQQGQGGGGQQGKGNDKGNDKAARERADLERKLVEESRKSRRNEKQMRDLRTLLDAKDAEIELREAARGVGVTDTGYALHLVREHLQGKEQAYLDTFKPDEFFTGLRASKPFLFGAAQEAANTSPGGNTTKVDAAAAAKNAGGKGGFDAMTASKEETNAYLKRLGIPTSGLN